MSGKHEHRIAHIGAKRRRAMAFVMTLVMLCSLVPSSVFALAAASADYLCGHTHDEACGYIAGVAGVPCDHAHDESCGYLEGSPCTDAHTHDAACGYAEATPEIPCACSETDADGSILHSDGCGHVPAAEGTPCTYTHTHDDTCGYREGSSCSHVCEDGACAYAAAVEGNPCNHICHITAFHKDNTAVAWTPDAPIGTYEAPAGASPAEISGALPGTLSGETACGENAVDIPVRWSCDIYSIDADTNIFRAELDNPQCDYAATEGMDESELPYIAVTFAAPVSEPVTVPVSSAPEQTTLLHETYPVAVSGVMPAGLALQVRELTKAETAAYIEAGVSVLFAYDITLAYPDGTEYQPTEEYPVTVTITPPTPPAAPVEIVHVKEDEHTGEATPEVVDCVTADEQSGAVAFAAEGFSIYIGTMQTLMTYPSEIYWNGTYFFSDEACTEGEKLLATNGAPFANLPELLAALDGNTTIYMKAGYTVSDTQAIGNSKYNVTLKRHISCTSHLITVNPGANLTLSDITIDGGAVWEGTPDSTLGRGTANSGLKATSALVLVSGGQLIINSGTVLQNNHNTSASLGGAVLLDSGEMTMTGGEIKDNTASYGGGMYNKGTLTISGCFR